MPEKTNARRIASGLEKLRDRLEWQKAGFRLRFPLGNSFTLRFSPFEKLGTPGENVVGATKADPTLKKLVHLKSESPGKAWGLRSFC